MSAALQSAFDLQNRDRLFIGGDWAAPSTQSRIDVINPTTEAVLFQVAEAQAEDVDRAVTAARSAFDDGTWTELSYSERATYLREMANAIRARGAQLATLHSSQMGILYREALGHPPWSADRFDYYADMAESFPFIERHVPDHAGKLSLLVREPVGVVGVIIPSNGPLNIAAPKLAPALVAGCTVVLKADPAAPGEALVLAEIAAEVGLPPGVLNVITAGRDVSECLVRDSRVDMISFTGSTAAGRKIGAIVAERVGRIGLELGGKSAAIILDDYDIPEAASTLAASGVRMTGQVCSSLTRIVVSRARHDEFVDALGAAMSAVTVGDPFDPQVGMGPLVSGRQREIVERYMAIGQEQGATLVTGGGRPEHLERGFFVEPTVFADVDNASTIAQEEIFGPVLSVIAARDERHAVEIANDSIYGLSAAVFSNDIDRMYDLARRIRSGTVSHNASSADFGVGFGGFKQSGIGRDGGRDGLYEYLEPKTLVLDDIPSIFGTHKNQPQEGAES